MNEILDISKFPRTETNDLNIIEYCKYLKIIKQFTEEDRKKINEMLLKKMEK